MSAIEFRRDRNLLALGSALLVVAGMVGCRRPPDAPSAPQQAAKPMVQEPAQAPSESDQEKSCREFVQGFYDWYYMRLNLDEKIHAGPASNDVLRLKPEVLDTRLRRLLREDAAAQAKDSEYVVGLDFDPFLNAQDWDGKYWVAHVAVTGNRCRAYVWSNNWGKKIETVDPELELKAGHWIFVNFHQPAAEDPGDQEHLVEQLLRLGYDRNRQRK